MQYPLDAAATNDGTIFVADRQLPGIWKITGDQLTLFYEGSPKYRTPLNAIRCLAVDDAGTLLAGDSATRDVYRVAEDGAATPLTDGGIGIPISIALGSEGQMFVADLELHRIWRVPVEGGTPEQVADVPAPRGVAVDSRDNVWVVSHGPNQILRIAPNGGQETVVNGRPFQFPHQIVLSEDNTAYVSDGYARTIWKIASGGKPAKFVSGEPLVNPVGLGWRGDDLLVADPRAKAVFQVSPAGEVTRLKTGSHP
jgi:sugar lactone lactonase YvrE